MLTQDQKQFIVDQLSQKINKPIVKTRLGKLALKMVVNEVDNVLDSELPPEIKDLLNSAVDGLTTEETDHLKSVLTPLLLKNVHNFILQAIMADIIGLVVDILIEALHTGNKLP